MCAVAHMLLPFFFCLHLSPPSCVCSPQVKHDPWAAAKWCAEVEKLQQVEEDTRASNMFEDMAIEDPALRASLQAMGPLADGRGMLVINAQCIVQLVNQSAADILGYSR